MALKIAVACEDMLPSMMHMWVEPSRRDFLELPVCAP
jgi:hypothetical protein